MQDSAAGTFEEYNVSEDEQMQIMSVMQKYQSRLEKGLAIYSADFESDIYYVFGGYEEIGLREPVIEHHFCKLIAKAFMEDRRWKDVYPALYGE